jgi:Dolichyl-phosphate-mannose-protein mannosyltransferase
VPPSGGRLATETWHPTLIVMALTAVGVVLRAIVADQSIFADELSTYWISATHGLGGVLSLLYGTGRIAHAEITPPLYFVLAWLTTRLGDSPELLRLPSLIAGTATIPIVYLLGLRTVGRRAALVATAVTALAPFAIYYSADARAYGVMMLALLVSTLAMLQALDTGRARWWGLYAISACAAFYSHYTCAFVLGAQLLWVVWAHPEARRAAVLATVAAGVGVLPWLPGLINDYRSPTVKILNALSPFTFSDIRIDLAHWVIGYPETFAGGLTRLPGKIALILFAAAVLIGGGGLISALRGAPMRARLAGVDRRVVLVVGLALATPVAELVLGVAGNSLFSVRDLGASWPYLALTGAAVLALSGPRAALLGAVLALIAFALGAVKMLGGDFQRPDYQGAASYVVQNARPGDVVVDETGALSPGPLTGLDVALHRRLPIVRAQAPAERDRPFGFSDPIVGLQQAVVEAVAAARGHRVFLVTNAFVTDIASLAGRVNPAPSQFPADYRLTAERVYPGLGATLVAVYADVGAQTK